VQVDRDPRRRERETVDGTFAPIPARTFGRSIDNIGVVTATRQSMNGQLQICRLVDTAMLMVVTPKSELRCTSVFLLRKWCNRTVKYRTVIALRRLTQTISSCQRNFC